MFCNSCGQSFDVTANFCKRCGAPRPINYPASSVAPSGEYVSVGPFSHTERLKRARILVALCCFCLSVIASEVLQPYALYVAIGALIAFAVGWSAKSVRQPYKVAYVLVSLIVVFSVDHFEIRRHAVLKAERQKARQDAEAKQRTDKLLAKQQADLAFSQMTPEQHLTIVKRAFGQDATSSDIDEGTKNLMALKGTRLEAEGQSIRRHYEFQKKQQEKAAATEAQAAAAEEQKAIADVSDAVRQEYAKTFQNNLYDENMNAEVVTVGPRHTTLRVTWVLASKMSAYKLTQSVRFDVMRSIGFKKFVLTDGWDHSWTWDIDKY